MAFVSVTPEHIADTKIDIIGIPGIYADPGKTWMCRETQWLGTVLQSNIRTARVLLYDHLTEEERDLDSKPLPHPDHERSTKTFKAAENRLGRYGLEDWADRFLAVLLSYRQTKSLQARPVIFVCHSTGGLVLKQALVKKLVKSDPDYAAVCLGIAFFATPHHGSSVLSLPEFATGVKYKLNLKWDLSTHLQKQLSIDNANLESLNHKFGGISTGIRIWSYYETKDTSIKVLTNAAGGESLTSISMIIVDTPSAEMSTSDTAIEEEEKIHMNTNHIGTARLADDLDLVREFSDSLRAFIKESSPQDRAAHHTLTMQIMNQVVIDVHQFYQIDISSDAIALKVLSETPSLQEFLEKGPSQCLKKRTEEGLDSPLNGSFNPLIRIRHASDAAIARRDTFSSMARPPAPRIILQPLDSPDHAGSEFEERLAAPTTVIPRNIHTRRPSLGNIYTTQDTPPETRDRLTPTRGSKDYNSSANAPISDRDRLSERAPQRAHTYQLPSKSTDRFRWIHVPYCISGWVPQILNTISRDKGQPDLHRQLLSRSVWTNHHNRSRHSSSHARFVKSTCKVLWPIEAAFHRSEDMLAPPSATEDVQFCLYIPYLHWDSFISLKARASVIKRRSAHRQARPVDPDILRGKSLEAKLIWQYLKTSMPIHCRRTLDQFGYPSLRNTDARDMDQVLFKATRGQGPPQDFIPAKESSLHNISAIMHAARRPGPRVPKVKTEAESSVPKVLMVDQLWLWIMSSDTVITFAAPKEKDEDDPGVYLQGDLRSSIYKDVNNDYAQKCEDCFDFAALVVSHACRALLDFCDDTNLQVFRVFEEYLSDLTEQQTKSFKEFRDNHRIKDDRDLDVRRLPKYVDNRDDLNNLLELRDIEDELSTILKLLSEQHKCIGEMLDHYQQLNVTLQKGIHGTWILREVDHTISGYEEQVKSMLKGADVAQEAFEKLLDMKQKQANIVEAHLAREQAEVAADSNRSVMIFTIFTIIFLPLSFFASVFGMNARQWSGVDTNPSLQDILRYMGAISLAVIVVALLVAFNRASRRVMQKLWRLIARPVTALVDRLPSRKLRAIVHYYDTDHDDRPLLVARARQRSASRQGRDRRRSYDEESWDKES